MLWLLLEVVDKPFAARQFVVSNCSSFVIPREEQLETRQQRGFLTAHPALVRPPSGTRAQATDRAPARIGEPQRA
jgi:hypothetical protein